MSARKHAPAVWKTLSRREIYADLPWIQVAKEQIVLPSGRVIDNFYQLTAGDYAVAIAKTLDGRLIMERQYKHGVKRIALFFPGGAIEKGETPLAAAKRELLEETGYAAGRWQSLGSYVIDANHRLCCGHFFLAQDAVPVREPGENDEEVAEIVFLTPGEAMRAIREGQIGSLGALCSVLIALNPGVFAPAADVAGEAR